MQMAFISFLCALVLLAVPPASAGVVAQAVLLAHEAAQDLDPAPYWVSEKLDGVRAIWDGEQLRFRSGRIVRAPAWFIKALPNQALDGELWMGRGQFSAVSGIVRRGAPADEDWRRIRYMIFELPGAPGDFSSRIEAMRRLVRNARRPWLAMVPQRRVANRAALQAQLAEVIAGGGEGLMLHRADARYETGRSDALLKLKPWQDDEAVVLAHVPGKGRFAGMLGALEVRLRDGRSMRIGTGFSDVQRRDPPAVGTQITFRYRGRTATGLPRFASFMRVREPL